MCMVCGHSTKICHLPSGLELGTPRGANHSATASRLGIVSSRIKKKEGLRKGSKEWKYLVKGRSEGNKEEKTNKKENKRGTKERTYKKMGKKKERREGREGNHERMRGGEEK